MPPGEMVQNCRQYSAGAAGRGSHYGTATGILLAYRERIGIYKSPRLEIVFVALGLDVVDRSLA